MMAHTPGPWVWFASANGEFKLATPDRGRLYVMSFSRKGMQGATPRFAVMGDDAPRGRRGGLMVDASELLVDGELTHPDARLIAAAPDMLAALQALLADGHLIAFPSETLKDCEIKRNARAAIKKATGDSQ